MKEMLAKPRVSFLTHTLATINVARYITEKYGINRYQGFESFLTDITKVAAFHDIGKCTTQFQKKLATDGSNDDVETDEGIMLGKDSTYRHNEVSAALYAGLFGGEKNGVVIRTILNHHPHMLKAKTDVCDILDKNNVSGKDLDEIVGEIVPTLCEMLKEKYNIVCNPSDFNESASVDSSYIVINRESRRGENDPFSISTMLTNAYPMLLSAVILYADRLVSENRFLSTVDDIAENHLESVMGAIDNRCASREWDSMDVYVDNLVSKMENVDFERLGNQTKVVKHKATTLSVCLPTGNGKTLPSLLSAINGKNRGIIVSPEISVTLSNKQEVDKLVRDLGITDANIGYMKSNQYIEGGVDSDFVCINIDSFLNFIYKNNNAKHMLSLFFDPIIFDEWHILCENNNAIMTLFTNILWIRHNLTKAHTLLLSATPINSFFRRINTHSSFNEEKVESFVAPSYKKDNKYHIVAREVTSLDSICNAIDSMDSTLVRVNSHRQASTILGGLKKDSILYSNRLTDNDIKDVTDRLLTEYCKGNHYNVKPNIVTTTKGEKSLNFSCKNCVEVVKSPIDTIQTLGRAPRCKTDDVTKYHCVFYDNKKTNERLQYPITLMSKWFKALEKYNGQIITEQDIYNLYDRFETENEKEILSYIDSNYREGMAIVKELTLTRSYKIDEEMERKTSNSMTLRGCNPQVFVTARNDDNDGWCQPIAVDRVILGREIIDTIDRDRNSRCKELEKIFKSEGMNNTAIKRRISLIKRSWDVECDYAMNEKYAIHLPSARYSRKFGLEI